MFGCRAFFNVEPINLWGFHASTTPNMVFFLCSPLFLLERFLAITVVCVW